VCVERDDGFVDMYVYPYLYFYPYGNEIKYMCSLSNSLSVLGRSELLRVSELRGPCRPLVKGILSFRCTCAC
jgi:hypothetical protein